MVLLRILLFRELQPSWTNIISLGPSYYRGLSSRFVVDSSPFSLVNRDSTLAVGESKQAKPKRPSSTFLNPSADSQAKWRTCPKFDKAKKRNIEGNNPPQSSGSFIFLPVQEKRFLEELSPEGALLMKTLLEELHISLKPSHIPTNYPSRHLLKWAAEKFGHRHQEIAKWLSGSDLKKIALFGCPSVERKTVFASKRLRSFFCIQEHIICRGCKLKASCNFVNQRVHKVDRVILADVMRLLTVLAFDGFSEQLLVPADLKHSIDKLLKEAVNLSQ